MSTINEYNEYEVESCAVDFEDPEFWMVMREEEYWMRPDNEQYNDFHQFWDAFHYGGPTDPECEWREIEAFCQDFQFLADEECVIRASYSPCETGYFMCEITKYNEYGQMNMENCAENFEDPEFWSLMRDEAYWFEQTNAEYRDFYEFWDMYHSGADCMEETQWFDFMCSEFSFVDPMDECRIEVAWNPCNATAFECAIRRDTDMGNAEHCDHDFRSSDFWAMFREEQVMQQEQFDQFMSYWNAFHANNDCMWDCDEMNCAEAFDLDYCNEKSCFNSCDGSYECKVEFVWEGEEAEANCADFYNYTNGNNTEHDCEWRDIFATCSDFAFIRQEMEQDPTFNGCDVLMRYSPCETSYFECELSSVNEYGDMEFTDCTADFEDGDWWMMMREEDFWMERELYDFYNFWEEYHGDSHDDYDDYADWNDYDHHCEERQVFGSCSDFVMLEGECQWQLFYNSCPENEVFSCFSEYVNEYGDLEAEDCAEDFFNKEFWMQFREEEWWFQDVNEQHLDLHMFFDMYHSEEHHDYDYDDDNCWWREFMGTCQDFSFSAQDTCDWVISWSPCQEDYFICESNLMNEYGMFELRDCSGDFTDIEFWEMMRLEQWWQQPDDELWGFYMFWEEYHYDTDNDYDHDDYHHEDDYCPWEPIQDGGDCLEDILEFVPGATECSYTETVNECTGE
jgi:hypothetical protein